MELKDIKDKLIEIYKQDELNIDDFYELLKNYKELAYKTNFDSNNKKIDYLLFYSFVEDYYHKYIEQINNDKKYNEIKILINLLKPLLSKLSKETGILNDNNELTKMRINYLTTDYSKIDEQEEVQKEQKNIEFPKIGDIYKCISNKFVRKNNYRYQKFKKNSFYKVVDLYKGKDTDKYHIVLSNIEDVNKISVDSYLETFDEHFDTEEKYNDKVIKKMSPRLETDLPPVGFVDDLMTF